MANVEHRTMVSADVHEPKHISDSTASDAGKVITPLSGGTSELRNLTPSEVGVNYYYLEWGVDENTTAIAKTAATDPLLYTNSDYTQITSANIPGATSDESNGMSFDSTNYEVTIPVDGIYKTEFWANIESDVNNTKIGFRFTLNGTPASSVVKHDLANLDRVVNISATSVANLSAGDKVGIAVASDKTANVQIDDLKLTFIMLREL